MNPPQPINEVLKSLRSDQAGVTGKMKNASRHGESP